MPNILRDLRKKKQQPKPGGNSDLEQETRDGVQVPEVESILDKIERLKAETSPLVQERRGCGCMD